MSFELYHGNDVNKNDANKKKCGNQFIPMFSKF